MVYRLSMDHSKWCGVVGGWRFYLQVLCSNTPFLILIRTYSPEGNTVCKHTRSRYPHGTSRFSSRRSCQGWRMMCPTIGGGAGGCAWASSSLPLHLYGRCLMLPGTSISATAKSVSFNTTRWVGASPGRPMVCPNGCSIATKRGTLTAAVSSGMFDKQTVENPACSISR